MAVEEKTVATSELAKAADQVAQELAKSQICTGSQGKVSHPDSTTENQVAGDAVAENGTDYRPGKPRVQNTALRKAIMDKIENGEALTKAEQLVLQDLMAKGDDAKEKADDAAQDKNMFKEMLKKKDSKKVEKAIDADETVKEGIDAAPVLKALADIISKGFEEVSERLSVIEKAVPASVDAIEKSVKEFGEEAEAFNVKHAELSVSIAKSIDELAGSPARGSRANEGAAAAGSEEPVEKSIEETRRPIDFQALANVMSDVLVTGRAGEFGMSDTQLTKAVTLCESSHQVRPEIAERFAKLIQ